MLIFTAHYHETIFIIALSPHCSGDARIHVWLIYYDTLSATDMSTCCTQSTGTDYINATPPAAWLLLQVT